MTRVSRSSSKRTSDKSRDAPANRSGFIPKMPPGRMVIEGTDLLVAMGRTPNTQGIGLDQAGVELNEDGYIKVNERLETTAANVWAMGECAGSPKFTHVAFDDFRVVYTNLTGGQAPQATGWCLLSCLPTRNWPGSG